MELVLGEEYSVSVVKFIPSGVVVKLEDGSTQLIHISKLSNKYVSDPSVLVNIGETLIARCVEGTTKPLELSIVHLGLSPKGNTKRNTTYRSEPDTVSYTRTVTTNTTPKSENVQSLDDMISDMNSAYRDKMRSKRAREMRRLQSKRR